MHSVILNEDRAYWVYLPDGYKKDLNKSYPVLYLLDGDRNFYSLVAIEKSVEGKRGNGKSVYYNRYIEY
ncbi:MAG: alpha/beta hydrolase-fold protein [Mangrovibacterium sp.]